MCGARRYHGAGATPLHDRTSRAGLAIRLRSCPSQSRCSTSPRGQCDGWTWQPLQATPPIRSDGEYASCNMGPGGKRRNEPSVHIAAPRTQRPRGLGPRRRRRLRRRKGSHVLIDITGRAPDVEDRKAICSTSEGRGTARRGKPPVAAARPPARNHGLGAMAATAGGGARRGPSKRQLAPTAAAVAATLRRRAPACMPGGLDRGRQRGATVGHRNDVRCPPSVAARAVGAPRSARLVLAMAGRRSAWVRGAPASTARQIEARLRPRPASVAALRRGEPASAAPTMAAEGRAATDPAIRRCDRTRGDMLGQPTPSARLARTQATSRSSCEPMRWRKSASSRRQCFARFKRSKKDLAPSSAHRRFPTQLPKRSGDAVPN